VTQPADTVTKFFRVRNLTTDALVSGLSTVEGTAFNSLGFKHEAGGSPASYALGSVYTDLTGGVYSWQYTVPSVKAHHAQSLLAVSANHGIEILTISGETESQDLDSLGALVAQPVGGAGTAFAFGSTVTLELAVYRQREVTQSFTATDLSTAEYVNWKIGIRDKDQGTEAATAVIWDCDSGKLDGLTISGDDEGLLTITFPESLIGPLYTTWVVARAYALGDFIRPTTNNGFIYEATVAGTSHAVTEPTWNTTEGATNTDGTVTWTCRKRSLWLASIARVVGDMVRPTAANPTLIYRCTVAGTSAGSEPTWPTTPGATIADGGVTWRCMSDPFAALAAGDDSLDVRYEVTADKLSTAKPRAIIPSSTLTLKRRENGV
jgi:hypothetical protein